MSNLPNINPVALTDEKERENGAQQKKVTSSYDAKNYLNVRLEEGDGDSKSMTIRLLPIDLETGNPFVHVHFHNVKVPKEVSKSGWKSYLCLKHNDGIDHQKFGTKCPFCELNQKAYMEAQQATDPALKKELQDISIANLSREAVIVRCIERGKEDEGVKFWKFNIRADKTDPYHQIMKLYSLRKEEGERAGVDMNILDIYNGVDLTVTVTQGNAAPTIVDGRIQGPVSKDEEQLKAWIYDTKKWQDVFTPKTYEYLSIVSQMKTPWYDKTNGVWVDKEEYDNVRKNEEANADAEVANAEQELLASEPVKAEKDEKQKFMESLTADVEAKPTQAPTIGDDSDLPF